MQVDGPEMETHPLGSSTSSLAFENDTVTHVRCHQMPEYKLGIKRVNFSKCKTRLLIDLNHCEYIFLRTSSAQDLNSSSLFTKHGHGKRGVLENKNKRATRKHSNFGGKTSMHKSTLIS